MEARHPAVLMWIGYDEALAHYLNVCEGERLRRGMKPHAEAEWLAELYDLPPAAVITSD